MSWFFIALWAPFLVACANHNDKFLLSRYLKKKNIGAIVILSSLFSGVAIAIVLCIQPDVYNVSIVPGSALVATGMLSVFAAVCYLYALDIDEASFVTPFYQTVEFVPAPFRLYTRYRVDTAPSSRGQGVDEPHEDAAKGRGN